MSQLSRSVLINLQTMAMAVLLAILVWFYAYAQDTGDREVQQVPIDVRVPPGVLIDKITGPGGTEVGSLRLRITASKSALRDLRNIACRVTLAQRPDGDVPLVLDVPLTNTEFELGPSFQVRPTPPSLRVTLVNEAVQRMRVRTSDCTTGTVRAGFRIVEVSPSPTFVSVRGPAAVVKRYREISVAKVDVSDQAEDFSQVTDIVGVLDGSKVRADSRVTLRFTLTEEEIEQEFKLPVRVLQPMGFAKVLTPSPETVTITVTGPRSEITKLNEARMVLYADLFEYWPDPEASMDVGGTYKPPLKLTILAEEIRRCRMTSHADFSVQVGK